MGGSRAGAPRLSIEKVDATTAPSAARRWSRYTVFAGSTDIAHLGGADNYVILSWPGMLQRKLWQPESVAQLIRAALPAQAHGLSDVAVKQRSEVTAFLSSWHAMHAINVREIAPDGSLKVDWDLNDPRDVAVYRGLLLAQGIDCYRLDVAMNGVRGAVTYSPESRFERSNKTFEVPSVVAVEHDPQQTWNRDTLEFMVSNHESSVVRSIDLSQLAFSLTLASRLIAAHAHSLDPSALV